LDCPVSLSQSVDLTYKKTARPFSENYREKENAAIFGTNVSRHNESHHGE
jgi:hypothetical protein